MSNSDALPLNKRRLVGARTRGCSEKIRVSFAGVGTYDLPMTSSDALSLRYRRLVGARTRGYSEKNPSGSLQ